MVLSCHPLDFLDVYGRRAERIPRTLTELTQAANKKKKHSALFDAGRLFVRGDRGPMLHIRKLWDRCYDFLNIFAEKVVEKIGMF
jgi:hypothetical protein